MDESNEPDRDPPSNNDNTSAYRACAKEVMDGNNESEKGSPSIDSGNDPTYTEKGTADTRPHEDKVKMLYVFRSVQECSKFNTQFSLQKMNKLLIRLTEPQKDLVRRYGFGSILSLRCACLPNPIALFLAKHYDPRTRTVKLPDGGSFSIDAITIHQIIGIPYGGKAIPSKPSAEAKSIILRDTNQSKKAAKIDDLISLIDSNLAEDKFVRIFLLIVLGIFLCPSSNSYVSYRYYEALSVVKDIPSYDWCSAVSESLHLGISHFLCNASKGNTSGKATLSGCLFALVAAYFDYLVVDQTIVNQTIPRISAWDDKSLSMYRDAEANMNPIQIKPIASTLFCKDHVNSSSFRGFYLPEAAKASCAQRVVEGTNRLWGHNIESETLDASMPSSKSTYLGQNQCAPRPIDSDSAREVMPASSNLSLNILCGEAIHPDVDKFIESGTTGTFSNDIKETLKSMCKSFFKDSVQQYVQSVEPVIVSQCCDMVRSFCSGLQQARANNTLSSNHERPIASGSQAQQKTCTLFSSPTERIIDNDNVIDDIGSSDVGLNEKQASHLAATSAANGSNGTTKVQEPPASHVNEDKHPTIITHVSGKQIGDSSFEKSSAEPQIGDPQDILCNTEKLSPSSQTEKRNPMPEESATISHETSPHKKIKLSSQVDEESAACSTTSDKVQNEASQQPDAESKEVDGAEIAVFSDDMFLPDPATQEEIEMDGMFEEMNYPTISEIESAREPEMGMTFATREEAYYFFKLYARKTGFAVRKDTTYKSRATGEVDKQVFVCNRCGKGALNEDPARKKRRNVIVKTECKVLMRVKFKDNQWKIIGVHLEHNHELAPSIWLVRFMKCHKYMSPSEKQFISILQNSRLPPRKVMSSFRMLRAAGFDAVRESMK